MLKKKRIVPAVCALMLAVLTVFIINLHVKHDHPKVVFVMKEGRSQYWKIIQSGAEKAFRDFRVDGKVIAPVSEDPIKQNDLLMNVFNQSPDVLVVSPIQPSAIVPVLMKYKEKNIPVLSVDTDTEWQDQTAFMGTDNFTLGRKAGELLTSMLQPGDKVALIRGDTPTEKDRVKGVKEALEAAGIKVAALLEDVKREEAKNTMIDILQINPDIKGVFGTNDMLALGAFKAAQEKGMKIQVVGADGIWEMVKCIEEGVLSGTVAQNPYDMGYQSVEHAVKAIRGEKVDKKTDSGVDIITKDNAKEKLDFLRKILQ